MSQAIRPIGCSNKNFTKGTISFTKNFYNQIKRGDVTLIKVTNADTGEEYPHLIDAQKVLNACFLPYANASYYVAPFRACEAVVYTQVELASAWEVRQCRLSELNRAELLIPDGKVGRTLTYSRTVVEKALQNPTVAAWIRNTKAVDKRGAMND